MTGTRRHCGLLAGLLLMLAGSLLPARAQELTYPALGILDADQGTIEFWLRLEAEAGEGRATYFRIFDLLCPGEPGPRAAFSYQHIWSPKKRTTGIIWQWPGAASRRPFRCTWTAG